MYKLLALDLDGTVLDSQHGIHPEVKAAIKLLKRHCHVMIVTGRHHTAAKPYHTELELTTPIICCNGTYVYDYHKKQVLQHNALHRDVAVKFIALAQKSNMKLLMYVKESMLYSKSIPVEFIASILEWGSQYSGDLKPSVIEVDSFEEHAQQAEFIWKFVVEGNPTMIKKFKADPWIQAHFNGEQSWHDRFDFAAIGNSKGKRLAQYADSLNIEPNDVVAIGDNHNDISMLQYAGLGVAMGNANSVVQQHANCICEGDNNGPELGHFIRRTFLL
jgi:Cof subfamily protein (haloacid dehalogenase superfamily)